MSCCIVIYYFSMDECFMVKTVSYKIFVISIEIKFRISGKIKDKVSFQKDSSVIVL